MAKLTVYNKEGKVVKDLELSDDIFSGSVNKNVLYQYVKIYQANQRQSVASTKTRSDLNGSNIKPWRQKGTGRARAGSKKSPIWRGGGIVFGPRPRDFSLKCPKKMKKLALISALINLPVGIRLAVLTQEGVIDL